MMVVKGVDHCHILSLLLMEKILHRFWCPKCCFYTSGAGFFPSTVSVNILTSHKDILLWPLLGETRWSCCGRCHRLYQVGGIANSDIEQAHPADGKVDWPITKKKLRLNQRRVFCFKTESTYKFFLYFLYDSWPPLLFWECRFSWLDLGSAAGRHCWKLASS